MSSTVAHFSPIFVLRRISPKEISRKYNEGYFDEKEIPASRIRLSDVFHISSPNNGSSPEDPRFQFKDKNNAPVIVVTSNSKNYTVYKQTKKFVDRPRTCPYCLRRFEHKPVPVVTKLEIEDIEKPSNPGRKEVHYIFWTINVQCCSFACAFAWTKRESYMHYRYKLAYEHLKTLFRFMHPGETFCEAPCWRLLEDNGGPLSHEEFDKGYYRYKETSNMIFLPAKEEFIQIQLK